MLSTGSNKTSGKRNKRKKDVIKSNEDLEKKMRTTFTGKQIFELEKSFESKKYLSSAERAELSTSLDVTQQQVSQGRTSDQVCTCADMGSVDHNWCEQTFCK